jgi:hypothetical protein
MNSSQYLVPFVEQLLIDRVEIEVLAMDAIVKNFLLFRNGLSLLDIGIHSMQDGLILFC